MNQVSIGKLSKVISAKITNEDYELLTTIANECCFKYRVINQPSITEIVRCLVRNCIKTRFPHYDQIQYNRLNQGPIMTNKTNTTPSPSLSDFYRQLAVT